MVERYRGGVVPAAPRGEVDDADAADYAAYHAAMDGSQGYPLHEALRAVWLTVARGNEYVDRRAPWKLAKDPAAAEALDATLGTLVRQLARQCVALQPFMPGKAQALWAQLGGPGAVADQRFGAFDALDPAGWRVARGDPLFPKAERPRETP